MTLTAVLTVGSTRFDPLVGAALSPSALAALSSLGVTRLLAQVGNSALPRDWAEGASTVPGGLVVEVVRFLGDLEAKVGEADLVVSHAGAGSILSFVRPLTPSPSSSSPSAPSTPSQSHRRLVLVPNSTLMDSHQSDLAGEMEQKGWAVVCREPSDLAETLRALASEVRRGGTPQHSFPALDTGKVQRILDEALGFV
ncbi:UDP-N-acetylglucosamine transferase subunit ALG13 [Rhodotorula diobovata]|uniref:UDP-N-acetylglucosamine transferase subunit ALG13 n=1 Tax=Rhodotorula diobovata TaxID=5288 RepID=A0A5C5FXH3_9BASI|nr:UDP-N-acetylglucosamine transferase subunit ALG13 [Rhodotorula diobovata]